MDTNALKLPILYAVVTKLYYITVPWINVESLNIFEISNTTMCKNRFSIEKNNCYYNVPRHNNCILLCVSEDELLYFIS